MRHTCMACRSEMAGDCGKGPGLEGPENEIEMRFNRMVKPGSNLKRSTPRVKKPAPISEPLARSLNSYALAAAASGVAVLACAMPAEGAPVCKTVSVDLQGSATFPLNPANQFAAPFNIAQSVYSFSFYTTGISQFFWWNRAFFEPNSAGAKVITTSNNLPADVALGAEIGPGGNFKKPASYGMLFTYGRGTFRHNQGGGTKSNHRGNLNLFGDNYIGFEFVESGQLHYGWIRLRITTKPGYVKKNFTSTHVLAYGYETTPNTAIAAGSCSGEEKANSIEPQNSQLPPANLGLLALGNPALPAWRRPQPLLSESGFSIADHQRPAAK